MENKQPPAKRKTDQSSSPPAPPAKQQKKETTLESVASRCRDAISGSLLVDPVIAEDGHTYERSTIREWFRRCAQQPTSPLTHERMGTELRRNFAVRAIVEDLASSPGLGAEERAEWHVARGRLLCERQESKDGDEANKPDVRAARAAFERAARLVDEPPAGGDAPPTALGEEARVCRDLCDALLDVARLRARGRRQGRHHLRRHGLRRALPAGRRAAHAVPAADAGHARPRRPRPPGRPRRLRGPGRRPRAARRLGGVARLRLHRRELRQRRLDVRPRQARRLRRDVGYQRQGREVVAVLGGCVAAMNKFE